MNDEYFCAVFISFGEKETISELICLYVTASKRETKLYHLKRQRIDIFSNWINILFSGNGNDSNIDIIAVIVLQSHFKWLAYANSILTKL